MKLTDAVSLINFDGLAKAGKSSWADLGCGDGLFTKALASLLSPSSTIFAIDTSPGIAAGSYSADVSIIPMKNNFVKDDLKLPLLDGILMANSLHFVRDQKEFINRLSNLLQPGGIFVIVEYDTDISNRWVPYPVSAATVTQLFKQTGFKNHRMLNRIPSVYQRADIYGCVIRSATML